jgi:transposase
LTHEGKSGGILSGEYGWIVIVTTPSDPLPPDLAAAHAMILAQRELLTLANSEVTVGRLEIERLKLMLAKARREQYGQSSERGRLLVEQLELAIEDLEETQAEQETKARDCGTGSRQAEARTKSAVASTSPAG